MIGNALERLWWHGGTADCDQDLMGSNSDQAQLPNNFGQVVHTLVPLSPSSIISYWSVGGQWTVMLCDWEGNHRSVFTLTICYCLQ